MNEVALVEDGELGEGEVIIIFPRKESFGGGIQENRLKFQSKLIQAYVAITQEGGEIIGDGGTDFSTLVGNPSIIGIKEITINGEKLTNPPFSDIIQAILEDTQSQLMTVIVHDE